MRKLICWMLLILSVQISAFAYDFIEDGFAFNILEDGTLSLTNKMKNFSLNKAMDQSLAYSGDIVVPATVIHDGRRYEVSSIGENAFYNTQELESVIISEGIRTIDEDAFYYSRLTSLNLPASLTELVPGFLHQCPRLTIINVAPNNMHYKSEGDCIYDKRMTQLIFVSPVKRDYRFPSTVTSVNDYAFNGSKIRKLVIPDHLTHIGGMSFYSSKIENIVCNKYLEKLPGSSNYLGDCPLPLWAMDPATIMENDCKDDDREVGRRHNVRYNSVFDHRLEEVTLATNDNGKVRFLGKDTCGVYIANAKYRCSIIVKEIKDLEYPSVGCAMAKDSEQLRFGGVGQMVD